MAKKNNGVSTHPLFLTLIPRYGGRATTTECPVAIVVMCVQSVIGIFIEVKDFSNPNKLITIIYHRQGLA